MGNAVLGTDYTYEYDEKFVRIKLGIVENTYLFEVYSENKIVYYEPLKVDDYINDLDDMIIKKVVKRMANKRDRWLDPHVCQWLIYNFDRLKYVSRTAIYRFTFTGDAPITLLVIEDSDKHTKLRVTNEVGKGKITCDFDVCTGEDIINTADSYASTLVKIAKVFEDNRLELAKSTLQKNIVTE